MAVDWAQAGQVGGVGFGIVFLVLVILSLAMWLTGIVVSKTGKGEETANKKKGA